MKFKNLFLTGVFALAFLSVQAQKSDIEVISTLRHNHHMVSIVQAQETDFETYAIGFYNLENLFDTINDPTLRNNDEFSPEGKNKWGTMKYTAKLKNMSYAISKIGVSPLTPDGVAILGVSEIENRTVLEDLVAQPSIAERNLQIVHYDGPDRRGVDCALLYNPKYFTVTSWKSIPFTIADRPTFKSRDQLLVSGILAGEEVHVIVNHWPSRYGGEVSSRPLRVAAAELSKAISDSLLAINPNAKIVIMGDLNDDPTNVSCSEVLNAKQHIGEVEKGGMYNTMWPIFAEGNGSLGYQDTWCLYDQIIVSYDWLGNDFSSLKFVKPEVFNKAFLTEQTGKRKGYPKRTHASGVWLNGFSDHYPTLIYVAKENVAEVSDLVVEEVVEEIIDTVAPQVEEPLVESKTPPVITPALPEATEMPESVSIQFQLNKSAIAETSAIDKVAEQLKSSPALKVKLVGHTCDLGNYAINNPLSERRAAAVKRMLLSRGVAANRITVVGVGSKEPLCPNTTEENRSKNRRVDIIFE